MFIPHQMNVSQMLKQGGIVNVFTKLHKQFRKCYMNIPYNWQKLCVLLPFKLCWSFMRTFHDGTSTRHVV